MAGPIPGSKKPKTINACIYGEPGSGKTILAGSSSSQGRKVLLLDVDLGLESLDLRPHKYDVWSEPVDNFRKLWEVYTWLRNEKHDYDWVWLDSISLFQEKALADIMADLIISKTHREEYVPDMREYLIVQNQLAKAVRHFCGLPINFGFTAYPDDFDLGEKQTIMMPMLSGTKGKYTQKVCGYLNFVGFLGVDQKSDAFKNKILTMRSGRYYAKNRFELPKMIENPDMGKITQAIYNTQEA